MLVGLDFTLLVYSFPCQIVVEFESCFVMVSVFDWDFSFSGSSGGTNKAQEQWHYGIGVWKKRSHSIESRDWFSSADAHTHFIIHIVAIIVLISITSIKQVVSLTVKLV